MTFTPIRKDELQPIGELFDTWISHVAREIVSRLHYAAQSADWAALQIAALYAAIPGVVDGVWDYNGTDASDDPGPGRVAVRIEFDQSRTWALSKESSEMEAMASSNLRQGSTVILTDDPATPPITAFRQYTVTGDSVDHGPWVSFNSVRIATFGVLATPPVGSAVRLIIR